MPKERLAHAHDLRQAIYEGGIEPSARYTVWRHLLNIFPTTMTTMERNEYLKEVSSTYEKYASDFFGDVSSNLDLLD